MRRRVAVDRQWGQAGSSVIENDRICSKCSEQCVQVNSYRGMAGYVVSGPRVPVPGWDRRSFPHSTVSGQDKSKGKYIEVELDRCIHRTDGKWGKPGAVGGARKPFSLVGSRSAVDSGQGRQWGKLAKSWGKNGDNSGSNGENSLLMRNFRYWAEESYPHSGPSYPHVFPINCRVIPILSPFSNRRHRSLAHGFLCEIGGAWPSGFAHSGPSVPTIPH